jgi:hypothetical protein
MLPDIVSIQYLFQVDDGPSDGVRISFKNGAKVHSRSTGGGTTTVSPESPAGVEVGGVDLEASPSEVAVFFLEDYYSGDLSDWQGFDVILNNETPSTE